MAPQWHVGVRRLALIATPPARRSLVPERAAAGALAVLVWLVYRQTLWFDFVMWDDDRNLYGNPHLAELSRRELGWMFTDTVYVRSDLPLSWLSLALIHRVAQAAAGDLVAAAATLEHALALDPGNAEARMLLQEAQERLSRREREAAEK